MLKSRYTICLCFYLGFTLSGLSQHEISKYEYRWAVFHPIAAKRVQKHLIEAMDVYQEVKKSKQLDGIESGGTLDAFRHTFTMAYLSRYVKTKKLRKLGKAHERGDEYFFYKKQQEFGERADSLACVMDLRNNGGGSLYEVVQMVGLFIKSGPVVQVRDKEGKSSVLSDNDPSVLYDGPLTVMVNGFSASASEIFAAAIQDYKRGIIIGSNSSTYGKGTVQRNVPLGKPIDLASGRTEYGAVKLTFQKFYRINGGSTQLKGVTPDVYMPDSYEFLKFREKDNPNALQWDEIAKADYRTWTSNISKIGRASCRERVSSPV